jgi:hypothetical protein
MAKDPSLVAKLWKNNLTSATTRMKESVLAMTENPMLKAAANGEAYIAGVTAAYADGKWQDALRGVDFAAWKDKTANIGTARIQAGAAAAEQKVQQFLSVFLPFTERVSNEIKGMPNVTDEDRRQRMLANFDKMKQFRYRRR